MLVRLADGRVVNISPRQAGIPRVPFAAPRQTDDGISEILESLKHGWSRTMSGESFKETAAGGRQWLDWLDVGDSKEHQDAKASLVRDIQKSRGETPADSLTEKIAEGVGSAPGELAAAILPTVAGGFIGSLAGPAGTVAGAALGAGLYGAVRGGGREDATPQSALREGAIDAAAMAATGGAAVPLSRFASPLVRRGGNALVGATAETLAAGAKGASGQDMLAAGIMGGALGGAVAPMSQGQRFRALQADRERITSQPFQRSTDASVPDGVIPRSPTPEAIQFGPDGLMSPEELARSADIYAGDKSVRLATEKPAKGGWLDKIKRTFWDVNAKTYEFEDMLGLPREQRVTYHSERAANADAMMNYAKLRAQPMLETLEAVDPEVGKILEASLAVKRVALERGDIPNPGNLDAKSATAVLDQYRQRVGPETFDRFHAQADDFRSYYGELIDHLEASGSISEKQAWLWSERNRNKSYIPFTPEDFVEAGFDIRKAQEGTRAKLDSPIMQWMGMTAHLIDMANRTNVGRGVRDLAVHMQNTGFGQKIRKLPRSKKVQTPEGTVEQTVPARLAKNEREVTFFENGEKVRYAVDKDLAEFFAKPDSADSLNLYNKFVGNIRSLIIDYNGAWALRNGIRDPKALYKHVINTNPQRNPLLRFFQPLTDALETARSLAQAVPETWRMTGKNPQYGEAGQALLRGGMIPGGGKRFQAAADMSDLTAGQAMAEVFSPNPQGQRTFVDKAVDVVGPLSLPLKAGKRIGEFSEKWSKVAAYKHLKRQQKRSGMSDAEMEHQIRTLAGSPNFRRKGSAYSFYNSVLMFSNAHKEGVRQAFEAAAKDPALYGMKTIASDIMPKIMMFGMATGAFDEAEEYIGFKPSEAMSLLSDYTKRAYHVIPIGVSEENGKRYVSALKLPSDHMGQSLGAAFWDFMQLTSGNNPDGIQHIVDTFIQAVPYNPASFHPGIQAALDITDYAQGKNPQDRFRGRPAIPGSIFDPGTLESDKAMFKHLWSQLGLGTVVKMEVAPRAQESAPGVFNTEIPGTSKKIKDIPMLGGMFTALGQSTDYGQRESYNKVVEQHKKEAARLGAAENSLIDRALQQDKNVSPMKLFVEARRMGSRKSKKEFMRKFQSRFWRMYGSPLEAVMYRPGVPNAAKREILQGYQSG